MEKNRQEAKLGVTDNACRVTAVQQDSAVRDNSQLSAELEQQKDLLNKVKDELHREIKKRETVEAALRKSEKKLQQFVQSIPAICLLLDEDGKIIEYFGNNDGLFKIANKEAREALLGKFFRETAAAISNKVRLTVQSNKSQSVIYKVSMAGGIRFFESRMAPVRHLADGKKAVAAMILDITERWEAEYRLRYSYVLRRRSDFFDDIIAGNIAGEHLAAQAKIYGVDVSGLFCCCLLDVRGWPAFKESGGFGPPVQIVTKLIEVLEDNEKCAIWNTREGIGALVSLTGCGDTRQISLQFAARLERKVQSFDSSLSVWIGISNPHTGGDGIGNAFRQARSALAAVRKLDKSGEALCHFRDIGVVQLLAGLSDKQALEFVQENLEGIIRYDAKKGTNLLQTLEVILQSSSLKEAAEKMYIHHKTIAFRKQRIEKILTVSLTNFETKMVLSAAVKLYKLYFY